MPSFRPYDDDFITPPNYVNYEQIEYSDLWNIFKQLFDLQQYKKVKFQEKDSKNLVVHSNKEFWRYAKERDFSSGQVINLKDFTIIEWIPFSPGLYYTEDAMLARREAERHINYRHREYTPSGKISMVNGGVGSIRLIPKLINNKEYNILGATSTGISHQGLPLLVSNRIYQRYIDQIKYNRGISATIVGRVRLIQDSKIIRANYYRGMPKYCIEVEDLVNVENVYEDVFVTVAIAYRNSGALRPSWTYTTIEPDKRDNHLGIAAEWLAKYMERYAGEKGGFHSNILNDFDEHVEWFPNTDFRLNNIIENKGINTPLLQKYFEANHIRIEGNVIIGNDNILVDKVDNSEININK